MPKFERPAFRKSKNFKPKTPKVEVAGSKSRAAAALIVEAVNKGVSMSEAVPQYCAQFDSRDTAFIKEIVYGTLRHRRILMGTLKPMFDFKITERNRVVQALLITAMYQIVYMRVPAHAVVSATVSACGDIGRKSFTSTTNAILRRFLREGAKVIESDNDAVTYSFPDWLVTRLQDGYDAATVKKILEASNIKAPLFLRVENSKVSTEEFVEHLAKKEISSTTSKLCKSTVKLDAAANVYDIPGFSEGLCTVQDISAQLTADFLKLDKDKAMRILDCCCAPGGKTAHILDLSPKSHVTALDIEESRLEQTVSTLKRLGRLKNVELKAMDATNLDALGGSFDRILVDAPCSGTGVIRRHPDIKWLRRDKDIAALCEIQAKILDAAYEKLSKGGVLLYTTCSILPDENIRQVEAFLKRHSDAIQDPICLDGKEYTTLQRLPGDDDGDGFFYARFIKPE
ncbi:MAG: 16S rRNA (cytosine(967)-C(5))-methyltransferase RsmB [Anaerobiospirillum succiniciproducens]|uniref:16S rRNA (cytosine(967)-C(5))-methyltransferase RsmB n=1 Tax=Anaerobiospirillum succiniciproducens TaxID=13335 RepID=UPI0026DAE060|nr:16S rRNA (cytosine(967)-C(5))-methyltransferase RsmB [Anaerobiospirillum succiniciproducens]MDO4676318.1 16S rRNA (cytosine(967)-C(5))-methyltransferase RsmB [Anaerobiospirillum succiniciproducens]